MHEIRGVIAVRGMHLVISVDYVYVLFDFCTSGILNAFAAVWKSVTVLYVQNLGVIIELKMHLTSAFLDECEGL